MKNMLSVVLPAYNEGLMIGKTCRVLREVLEGAGIPYELVLVNDGSSDNTWEEILKAGHKDPAVLGVRFSRNFGKEAAVFAGMAQASGDVVAVMDCDLQHPPETLIEMYALWKQGYEVIEGVKKSRGRESFLHKESAGFFYGIMSKVTGVNMQNASDFKMMDRQVVDNILAMPERNMFFRATSSWVGFRTASVEFEVREREAGESKWSTWSLVKYAFTNIVAFTTLPLQFVTVAGGICFPGGLPDGGALMDYRRDSFVWIYGYNRCQKFLWGQGKETDDPERFPCGSFCGYRLWCIHDVISGGME